VVPTDDNEQLPLGLAVGEADADTREKKKKYIKKSIELFTNLVREKLVMGKIESCFGVFVQPQAT
jgi:hypothetical protein